MSQSKRYVLCIATILLLIGVLSCGGGSPTKSQSPDCSRTPLQYFKEEQTSIWVPHGKVMPETAEEKNNKIEFQTEHGQRWRVNYTKRADCTYEYYGAEEVK